MVTQQLINAVHTAGFNTLRIPCAWNSNADQSTLKIDPEWLARVKEVVDYGYANGMYVILNSHWDNGWLEENPYYSAQDEVNKKQKAYWTQIADYFQDYDEHLLFAGTNEVHHGYDDPSSENVEVQQSYLQTFVDAVRATGDNNASRTLIVQTYNANIGYGLNYFTMPNDIIANRLMVEVHHYDPYDFTLNTNNTCIYWGSPYPGQSACSWAQEGYIDDLFSRVKAKWTSNGIPVIMGEYGAIKRTSLNDPDAIAAREYWLKYNTKAAQDNGVIPIYWDNGYTGDNGLALFDRNTGAVVDQGGLNALTDADSGSDIDPIAVTGITLSDADLEIKSGETHKLSADIQPANATDQDVTWTSDHPGVAGVDKNGLVTGIEAGEATITATTSNSEVSATCSVTVAQGDGDGTQTVAVTGVTVTPTSASVGVGATMTLTATVSPSDADDPSVTWSSSDPSIATVDVAGVVTGVANGNATITATTTDGGFTATSSVSMSNDEAEDGASGVDFSLIGYATQNGGTSGGSGGTTVTASTGDEILDYISQKKSGAYADGLIILVNGTITPSNTSATKIDVKDCRDVSIIGHGAGAEFNGIGIKVYNAGNVIIRNLTIHHVDIGDKDCIGIEGPADHIWIDHCEIYNEYSDDVDKDHYDGLLDAKADAEYITYSWNYLHDSWKTMLVGSSDSDNHDRKITIHHNIFEHCNSRMPLYRFGTGHVFNNYFVDGASTAINSRMGACLRIEKNIFEDVQNPYVSAYSEEDGYGELIDNILNNSTFSYSSSVHELQACTLNIPYSYSGVLNDVATVLNIVLQYAGVGKLSDPVAIPTN